MQPLGALRECWCRNPALVIAEDGAAEGETEAEGGGVSKGSWRSSLKKVLSA